MDYSSPEIRGSKYVIYVRKSTDDDQKQVRSIDDQIKECGELAHRLNLNVIGKPIEEEVSAKRPNKRPKFNKMLKRIESGEINGIIAWHPDRLARNMTEGGGLIQLVDDGKLMDMRFVSFPFSNDANGKMMLGIQFALSKHYSDKLSTDIKRGQLNNLQEGKSGGHYKAGYYRDPDTGLYHRDPKNFPLIKKAWEMKLSGEPETQIVEWLNDNGYSRVIKKKQPRQKKAQQMNKGKLNKLFANPIYYGILKQGGEEIDLRELYEFEEMVTEGEFLSIQKTRKNYTKEQVKHAFPFRDLIYCNVCKNLRVASPSKGKKANYVYFRCDSPACAEKGKSTRTKVILDTMYDVLKNGLNIEKINRKKLEIAIKKFVKEAYQDSTVEINNLKRQEQVLNGEKDKITDAYLENGHNYDKNEKKAYEAKKLNLSAQLKRIQEKTKRLEDIKDASVESVESTLNTLKKAPESLLYGDVDTKNKIARIVFLNTYVEKQKVASFTVKEPFNELINHPLVSNGGA